MCRTGLLLHLFVRLLAVRSGAVPSPYLAFENMFVTLNYLAQSLCRGKSLVLPQLHVPCLVQWRRTCPFLNGDSRVMDGDGIWGIWESGAQEGGETVVGI